MLKYCFSDSSHRDEQNEMQLAYVWVKNNEVSILAILTQLIFTKTPITLLFEYRLVLPMVLYDVSHQDG